MEIKGTGANKKEELSSFIIDIRGAGKRVTTLGKGRLERQTKGAIFKSGPY